MEDYILKKNRCPPNAKFILKAGKHHDQDAIKSEDANQNNLEVILDLKLVTKVKLKEHENLQNVSSEKEACTHLDVLLWISLDLHGHGHNTQHKLCEPEAEPVDVVFAVRKEILCLSNIGAKHAHSISEGLELFATWKEQKHGHCNDVEVKGKNFIVQPCDHLTLIDDAVSAVIKDDGGLDSLNGKEVDEDFKELTEIA